MEEPSQAASPLKEISMTTEASASDQVAATARLEGNSSQKAQVPSAASQLLRKHQVTAAQIRTWARDSGHEIPSRGALSLKQVEAYLAAHSEVAA